jgi:hypothetical protein
VIAACGGGGDGDDGSGLPPAGEHRFTVTGTMEVEFLEEGVSAGPITLQETETGEVSGSLTSVFNEDGSFTIPELGITVDFGDQAITITQAEQESNGKVDENGTTVSLNVEAALDSDEPVPSETSLELESDGKLGVDPEVTLTTPEDSDPNAGLASEAGFIIHQILLLIEQEEEAAALETVDAEFAAIETEEAQSDDSRTSFTDPEGDEVFCDSGKPANNPTVDVVGVNFFGPPDSFHVEVFTSASPAAAFDGDFSWSIGVSVGDQDALAEIHEGKQRGGSAAVIGDESVVFSISPLEIDPGTPWNVKSFSQPGPDDSVSCDSAGGLLP